MARERFPISELVARTGIPAPTVHHYLGLGLLPPAVRVAPNRFLYDERHVQRLRLIRALRERRRLPLATIRRILPDLLGLTGEEGFRPDVWDQALDLRARRTPREPATRLMEAAMEAFSRRGYGEVNVDDICRAARIAKGSFYRHHRSKEDLFLAVANVAGQEAAAAFERAAPHDPIAMGEQAPARGAEALARSLEPRLPIFLDLVARAWQRRPGYQGAAQVVLGDLVRRVGATIDPADPQTAGMVVLHRALGILLGRLLWPWAEHVASEPGPAPGRIAGDPLLAP